MDFDGDTVWDVVLLGEPTARIFGRSSVNEVVAQALPCLVLEPDRLHIVRLRLRWNAAEGGIYLLVLTHAGGSLGVTIARHSAWLILAGGKVV